ncbi:SGNH/GDSL hydrolase family protein [Streptosporangium sp. CA-135522]|uniref:SGNH/GDSL hydrolase family protein n=1 Tax=Streptosporangium sp. CA-135522 TaxID=3240072 RepID=UPI003D8A487E
MRHRFLAALATVPLIALGTGAAPASTGSASASASAESAESAARVRYVSLGDSFSSGSGAGDYDPDSGLCRRSANSHPALWARANHPATFTYDACGGAVTDDVVERQIPDALNDDTSLITITAGGTDAGFEAAVVNCIVAGSAAESCNRVLDEAGRYVDQELPGKLMRTYDTIRAAAPDAEVFVAGYPHLFELGRPLGCGVVEWRRKRMNQLVDHLDEIIQEQAENVGFGYVEVRDTFAGHGVCAAGGVGREWITRIVPANTWQSYHPNRRGQSLGYLPALTAAIG